MPAQPDAPPRDGGGPETPDWPGYYRHTAGREPRPLFERGMSVLAAAGTTPGQAIEIGFGDGTETVALLGAGWRVLAIDSTPAAAEMLRPQVSSAVARRLEVAIASAETVALPAFDLLYSGYALSYLAPPAFRRLWTVVRGRLRPGGHLVVNIFGDRDTWADEPGMTFVGLDALHRLVDGLEVVSIVEEDADGDSFVGPKHWHVFDLIARRPQRARR
jgi:SAM-dependent methyltransferase